MGKDIATPITIQQLIDAVSKVGRDDIFAFWGSVIHNLTVVAREAYPGQESPHPGNVEDVRRFFAAINEQIHILSSAIMYLKIGRGVPPSHISVKDMIAHLVERANMYGFGAHGCYALVMSLKSRGIEIDNECIDNQLPVQTGNATEQPK